MDPGSLMRLCFRPGCPLTSAIASPRPSSPRFSVLRRNLDRRRLDGKGAIYRGFSSSIARLQQQAAVQERSEDDNWPAQFKDVPQNPTSRPTRKQTSSFQNPQPTASETPSSQPRQTSTSSVPSKPNNTIPSQRQRMYDIVPPSTATSSTSPQPSPSYSPPPSGGSAIDVMSKSVSSNINRNLPTPTAGQALTQKVASQVVTDSTNRLFPDLSLSLRLKPALGRTALVDVNRGQDVHRAILTMERAAKLNHIKVDERKQRFHVRAGQKRKDLKSRRWRRQFKEGFQHAVKRVQRMRRQGW